MIPDEAVEAAQEAVIAAMIEHGPDGHIDGYEEITRAALEAAIPHVRAQALEEAADAWDMRSGEFEDTAVGYLRWCAAAERATRG